MKRLLAIGLLTVSFAIVGLNRTNNKQEVRIAMLEQQLNSIQLQLTGDTDWLDTTIKHISPKVRKSIK